MRTTALPAGPAQPVLPPLVYVTLVALWGTPDLFRGVVAALAGELLQLVITTGDVDPAELGELRSNVTAVRYRPQEIFPYCSAVIHHAGAGTMLGALVHGLPQVALPQAADNFVSADLLAGSGVPNWRGAASSSLAAPCCRRSRSRHGLRPVRAPLATHLGRHL